MKSASLIFMLLLSACGGAVSMSAKSTGTTAASTSYSESGESSARFIFKRDHFTKIEDFITFRHTSHQCLGDVLHVFKTSGSDYTGSPTSFSVSDSTDSFLPTYMPDFVRNVSVDMTRTYYPETVSGVLQSDACSYRSHSINPSPCADFDPGVSATPAPPSPTVTPSPVPTATPSSTPYLPKHGFYRVRDDWCVGQGAVRDSDPSQTQSYVGGVNIDLNRKNLGASEDLLMVMTYQAFIAGDGWPFLQGAMDETQLQISLVGTGLGLDLLMGAPQPRAWMDYQSLQEPVYLDKIVTLRDPVSSLRTEQIYIPLSQNALIDRIRIDRVRGSYHLYQIDLYRLGDRSP